MATEQYYADTFGAAGTVTTPSANQAIATATVPAGAGGVYRVNIKYGYGATAGVVNDFKVRKTGVDFITPLANTVATSTLVPATFVISVAAGDTITVNAIAGGGSGIYIAEVLATRIG